MEGNASEVIPRNGAESSVNQIARTLDGFGVGTHVTTKEIASKLPHLSERTISHALSYMSKNRELRAVGTRVNTNEEGETTQGRPLNVYEIKKKAINRIGRASRSPRKRSTPSSKSTALPSYDKGEIVDDLLQTAELVEQGRFDNAQDSLREVRKKLILASI